ncbi:hypothetical protein CF392_15075 [Tamilnaduibacter salinus]|uniref:SprT-like family protein n=1 Tax=Tamilnaduibacter salinus TaxID=1484056 RepID=A0A2A2HYT1_9GAMM|nr:hypothetical protein [Tamilnaduibacter salinus]PAV24651.1 hypothetical protein CF392_15075 [Tamilnaduibacter salinus]
MTAPQTSQALARLMCEATETVLWRPARDWIQYREPGSELTCRIGSGQATYHQFDPRSRRHQITFGRKMVTATFDSVDCQPWLSTREIRQRHYFRGDVSTLHLLAHTCCHEFAHLLQHVSNGRQRGSVHNTTFYRILDELHASGGSEGVKDCLLERARAAGLDLPTEPMTLPTLEAPPAPAFEVGDTVRFPLKDSERKGRVIRVNRKTCTVEGTGRWRRYRYRVPPSLLSKL